MVFFLVYYSGPFQCLIFIFRGPPKKENIESRFCFVNLPRRHRFLVSECCRQTPLTASERSLSFSLGIECYTYNKRSQTYQKPISNLTKIVLKQYKNKKNIFLIQKQYRVSKILSHI